MKKRLVRNQDQRDFSKLFLQMIGMALGAISVIGVVVNALNVNSLSVDQDSICTTVCIMTYYFSIRFFIYVIQKDYNTDYFFKLSGEGARRHFFNRNVDFKHGSFGSFYNRESYRRGTDLLQQFDHCKIELDRI